MATNTIAMYFKVVPSAVNSDDTMKLVEKMGAVAIGPLSSDPVVLNAGGGGEKLYVFQGQDGSHMIVRVYQNGLITIDVQHMVDTDDFVPGKPDQAKYGMLALRVKTLYAVGNRKRQLSEEYIRTLEVKLREHLGDICIEGNSLYAPIRRGQEVWPYIVSADERLQELDYDRVVVEKDSKWQRITILHSKENGNVLMLDGDSMLGESDLIYTTTLCCMDKESYTGKEVLILGGGDGGILHELLKQNPKFITMAEIDEEVMIQCRTYMRSVCGDSMDKYEGPNYKIVIEDCVKVLHDSIQAGIQYDFVINDLTEFPVDKALKGYGYDFETTSLITELSLKAIKPDGRLLARGNCLSADDYRMKFEGDLNTLGCEFKRKDVYVPSFHETYCLYEIWKP